MKTLIIGGTSLFGQYLAERLTAAGEALAATKLPTEKLPENLEGNQKIAWSDVDIMDPLTIVEVLKKVRPQVIYNFAVQNSVSYAWRNPGATVDVNVIGALNLLDAVRQLDYKPTVLLAGSGEEYGRMPFSAMPQGEDKKPNPGNIFAASKVCQTMMAQIYCRAYGMQLILVRTFNETGPGQSGRFVVSNFCRQFARIEKKQAEPVLQVGNLAIQRDFTDVRDLVRAFALLAEKGRPGEIYNAGRGQATPIAKVLDILQERTGITVQVEAMGDRIRPVDTPIFEADVTKIYNDTGWKAEIPLEQTVQDMLDYWRARV
ncbi:MAG: GDP-mannose 4,6-dehydratase [Gemmiger sp.]|nr:GDP-mannose 4,6-dehydratase [Gemmiger sp.]